MHRYLYANSNPFMYVDPTGRVAWLKKVADWFGDGADAAIDIASDLDFGDGTFANAAETYVGAHLGVLAGVQQAVQGVLSTANTTANMTIVAHGLAMRATGLSEADYAVGALKELNQVEEDLGAVVDFAKEASKNPGKVLKAASKAALDFGGRVASGDPRAVAQTSAVVTEFGIGVITGKVTQQSLKGTAELGETVVEQTIKQSKKARKASVLVEGKKTPKTAPKKVKAPDSPGGGNKGPTRGFQEYAKKDAAIQRQVRRAELDQKFGRSGDLNADISSSGGYTKRQASNTTRQRVLQNLEASRAGRPSEGFANYAYRERALGIGPDVKTGRGFGASDRPVRMEGAWSINDMKQGLLGHPPRGLGKPDLHHGGQLPGAAKHEVLSRIHRGNRGYHPNKYNQGVTPAVREADRKLHWWYRAREQGADQLLPSWIYD